LQILCRVFPLPLLRSSGRHEEHRSAPPQSHRASVRIRAVSARRCYSILEAGNSRRLSTILKTSSAIGSQKFGHRILLMVVTPLASYLEVGVAFALPSAAVNSAQEAEHLQIYPHPAGQVMHLGTLSASPNPSAPTVPAESRKPHWLLTYTHKTLPVLSILQLYRPAANYLGKGGMNRNTSRVDVRSSAGSSGIIQDMHAATHGSQAINYRFADPTARCDYRHPTCRYIHTLSHTPALRSRCGTFIHLYSTVRSAKITWVTA